MEHYKSTLATTAVAAFGLVVAAHILHPGNYEDLPRHVRAAAVSAEAPASTVAWTDPPTHPAVIGSPPSGFVAAAQAAEAQPAPVSPPVSVPAFVALAGQAGAQEVQAQPPRKVEAARRHRVAQRKVSQHQALNDRVAPIAPAAEDRGDAARQASEGSRRFDPIGNLIHDLGLDS